MQIVHFKPEDPVAQMDLTADRNNKYTGEDAQDQSHFDLTIPKTNPYPVLGRGQRVQGEREREPSRKAFYHQLGDQSAVAPDVV
jgi:hypothetical protein